MSRARKPLLFIATACLTAPLFLQQVAAAEKPAAPLSAKRAAVAPKPATETPRDPAGITGISPFWESVNKGDAAFLAQDLTAATNHYQAAITSSPKDPVGHLRMAEVSLKQNELARASEFITAALRFADKDFRSKAAASFLLAELRERQAMNEDAKNAWSQYKALDSQLPKEKPKSDKGPLSPHIYAETADSRVAAIDAKKKLDDEYTAVRERIQANIDKADSVTGAAAGSKKDE